MNKNNNSNLKNDFMRYMVSACIVFFFSTFIVQAKTLVVSEEKNETEISVPGTEAEENTLCQEPSDKTALEKIRGIYMKILNTPGETIKNEPFASAYRVVVTDPAGKTVPGFTVSVSYPASRDNGTVIYKTKKMQTDENGLINFMPDKPQYSLDGKISFYPAPLTSSYPVVQAAQAAGVTAPYKVKTDFSKKDGIVYVFDFNEAGEPEINSPYVLRDFINSRIRAGNSPIPSADYLFESADDLYKTTYKIVKDPNAFLVCGSIKYVSPVKKNSDGKYVCTLAADIYCIDMKDGSVIFRTQQTDTATDNSKFRAVDNCRQTVAAKTVHAVIYGM